LGARKEGGGQGNASYAVRKDQERRRSSRSKGRPRKACDCYVISERTKRRMINIEINKFGRKRGKMVEWGKRTTDSRRTGNFDVVLNYEFKGKKKKHNKAAEEKGGNQGS